MRAFSLLTLIGAVAAEDLLFHSRFTGYEDTVASGRSFNSFKYNWTYTIASTREWQEMTTDDFKKFKAIIIGDPISTDPDDLEPLFATRQTWGPAISGNVILIGTDTSNHYSDAQELMTNGIAFAATGEGTGLYFSLSKYYGNRNKTNVPILDIFGSFEVRGDLNAEEEENCYDEVHIVARNQVLDGITDQVLSNWSCSVHEAFVTFPSTGGESFIPLAIAQGVPGEGSRDFSDGTSGIPYILVRGASPIGCGNGKLDPGEECDDGNLEDGDGCNKACRIEPGFKKKASGGAIAGGVIGALVGVAALGGLGFLAVTKTLWGAKAGAAIGIGTSSAAGGGGGAGSGAAGASGAMYVPTGAEAKAAASYIPGVTEKAANMVAQGAGQAAHGAAQAGQGLSSMAVPPPTDAGATAASSALAPPVDPTSAAGAASTAAPPPGAPPGWVPGSETIAAQGVGSAAGGASTAGGMAPGVASATGGLAPGVASTTGGLAPGVASATGAIGPGAASATGGIAPGFASATGGLAPGAAATGGGLSTGGTIGTTLAAGFAGFGAALFGRRKKNKNNAQNLDNESMPYPPMAPDQQQQYYNYPPQPEPQYPYQQQPQYPPQPQAYYPQQQQPILYAPQPVPPPAGVYDEKEIKTGESSQNANLNIGVQEVVPTPSYEVQSDPISRPSEMPISEQPYIPPPPPSAAQRKEYDYN